MQAGSGGPWAWALASWVRGSLPSDRHSTQMAAAVDTSTHARVCAAVRPEVLHADDGVACAAPPPPTHPDLHFTVAQRGLCPQLLPDERLRA